MSSPVIEVIRGATMVAAALLQRDGELGVIAVGAAGDLVGTDEDPSPTSVSSPRAGQVVDGEAAVG